MSHLLSFTALGPLYSRIKTFVQPSFAKLIMWMSVCVNKVIKVLEKKLVH